MPANKITPPVIIKTPINFEPYCLDMINETAAKIPAGATPIEMNWISLGSASNDLANSKFSGTLIIKL